MRHRPPRCDPPSHHRFSCADDGEPSRQSPLSGSAYALILAAQRRGKEVRRQGKKDPESALPSGCLSAVKRGTSITKQAATLKISGFHNRKSLGLCEEVVRGATLL